MTNKYGIATHLSKFNQTQLLPLQAPTLSLLSSLKSIEQILKSKKELCENQIKARSHIQSIITYQQARVLKQSKQRVKQNEKLLKIIEICRQIDIAMINFEDNIQAVDFDQFHRLRERLKDFKTLYLLIQKLDEQFNNLCIFEKSSLKFQEQASKSESQVIELKIKYFQKLKNKLYRAIVEMFYSKKRIGQLQSSFQYFRLPIRNTINSIDVIDQSIKQEDRQYNKQDQAYKHYAYCIIEALFCEYCCYCLQKKLEMIFGSQQNDQIFTKQPKLNSQEQKKSKSFFSQFFAKLWSKTAQSLVYIFISPRNLNEENNVYQIDEPNWMFQYMEQSFSSNYKFISQKILELLKMNNQTKQIIQYIQTYFIAYNVKNFFLKFVIMRLQSDMRFLKQQQKLDKKSNKQQNNHSAFIIFNFLDQLHALAQKIFDNYQYESNLIQSVLLWAQKNSQTDVLALNFDYEHNWIEQRIFGDFANINYSTIKDLKNVEAYNITVNFTLIFQKLYGKFRKVTDQQLKSKINEFYYQKLLQLVRHIKTSFQRIYNYSQVDKYETLISYKKVEDQFRAYFSGFIHQSPAFQQKIINQYYTVLQQHTSVLALQRLTSVHKQMYKKLSDSNDLFTRQNNQNSQQVGQNNKKQWNQIFEEWKDKINKIWKLQTNYEDKKLRNIFFTFLQSIEFSEDGYFHFLSLFQPFLIVIFSLEGANTIKMLLGMEKGTLKEYIKTHQNSLWFLTSGQIKSIEKTKIGKRKRNSI